MKKNVSLMFVAMALVLAGCTTNPKPIEMEGADKDLHNCKASAGYTWSELKKTCVRIFEAGTPFNAYGKNQDPTLGAYVIVSEDQSKAEVFVPSGFSNVPVILDANKFEKDNVLTLFENKEKKVKIELSKNKYLIVIKDEPVFSQDKSKEEGLGKILK